MDVRYVSSTDYHNSLVKWWKFWRFPAPNLDMLPESGIIVSKDGVDICAGYLYFTNSKIAWLEYVVSNNEVRDRELRKEAICHLINTLSYIGKESGFKYIYASIKHQALIESYVDCGFMKGTESCTELFKLIK